MKGRLIIMKAVKIIFVSSLILLAAGICCKPETSYAVNPYLPLWEHIPDGEPYIFEDPDNPGKYRLYVYGSHDTYRTEFCGDNLVVWSAPVEDLSDWRYDGVIFEYNGHTLYAPDVAEVVNEDGSKVYYLYPNDQNQQGVIARADNPAGPFEVCSTNGILGFDPAVFVDDDGRVYGYWGFQNSYMAELDPDTMCTLKSGCKVLDMSDTGIDGSEYPDGPYRFFEASSIRKITDNGQTKYVLIYSRKSMDNEFGFWATNSTLAYAYSDEPLGPWTYGGTIVDIRGKSKDNNGNNIATMPEGNTHGSIVCVNGQWYIFYHRCINQDIYSRQGTAEPVDVSINDAGEVIISEAEITSSGLEVNGLNPYRKYSAGIMCYRIGSSYVKATYDENDNGSPVVNNTNGSIVGYKYFNFNNAEWQKTEFALEYMAKGIDGQIKVMLDSPWEECGGTEIGTIDVSYIDSETELTRETLEAYQVDKISGKHALYLVFSSNSGGEIADLYNLEFVITGQEPVKPFTPPVVNNTEVSGQPVPGSVQPEPDMQKSDVITPAKAKIKKLTVKSANKILVIFKKNKANITGHKIVYSTGKKFKNRITKYVKGNRITLRKLNKGKVYYIKVRDYIKQDSTKIYGKWSNVVKIRLK